MNELTVEQVQELYDFLQGHNIDSIPVEINTDCNSVKVDNDFNLIKIMLKDIPCLSSNQAFSIIYILQEYFKIIQQNYEVCEYCNSIFDIDNSGHHCDCEDCEQINSCVEEHGTSFYNILKTLNGKFFCDQNCEHRYLKVNGE